MRNTFIIQNLYVVKPYKFLEMISKIEIFNLKETQVTNNLIQESMTVFLRQISPVSFFFVFKPSIW